MLPQNCLFYTPSTFSDEIRNTFKAHILARSVYTCAVHFFVTQQQHSYLHRCLAVEKVLCRSASVCHAVCVSAALVSAAKVI